MSKYKEQPKDKLQKRNRTNTNDSLQKKNIFQLIKPINKQIKYVDINTQDVFLMAENLIAFLELQHPEELKKLKFNKEQDSIHSLIALLVLTITNLKYTIVYDSENINNSEIRILYEISYGEWFWYIFNTDIINKIPTEELKIGYAYFIKHLSQFAYHSAINSDYTSTDDTEYSMEFEMIESEERAYNEDGDYDEGMQQSVDEEVYLKLHRLQEMKMNFDKYLVEPLNTFLEYKPDDDSHKQYQHLLKQGLLIDFSIKNKFMPDCDVYDGGIGFDQSLLVYFDSEEDGVEKEHFGYMQENSNQGVSNPMGWFSIENGTVENKTSKEDIEDLNFSFKYLSTIYDEFLNKI